MWISLVSWLHERYYQPPKSWHWKPSKVSKMRVEFCFKSFLKNICSKTQSSTNHCCCASLFARQKNISIIIHFIIWFLGFWTANVFLLHLVCNVLDFEVFCENFFLRLPPKASIVVKHLWRVTGARKPVITRPKGRLSHCSDILSG